MPGTLHTGGYGERAVPALDAQGTSEDISPKGHQMKFDLSISPLSMRMSSPVIERFVTVRK